MTRAFLSALTLLITSTALAQPVAAPLAEGFRTPPHSPNPGLSAR